MTSIYDQVMSTLYMVWRKRWYGLAAMWAVCLVGWGVVATIPDVYEATARVFVDTNTVLPRIVGAESTNVYRQVDIVRRTLVSRPNLEKVIRRSDLDLTIKDDTDMEKLIADLTKNISVKEQGGDLFTLSYRSGDPSRSDQENAAVAKRVVTNLINMFVEGNMEGSRESYNETRRFIEQQIQDYEKQLEEAERRKAEFERQNLGYLPGDANYSQRLVNAQTQLQDIEFKLQQATSSRRALASQLASVPQTIPGAMFSMPGSGPRLDPSTTAGRIETLERQITDSLARGYTDQHPDIVTARDTIARLRRQLEAEQRAPKKNVADPMGQPNPVYVDLKSRLFDKDSEIASLAAQRAQYQREIGSLTSKAETIPGIEAERAKLNRDYSVLKAKYEELLKSREETRVASDLDSKTDKVQFRIVDPPEVPLKPVAPNRPMLLGMVMMAGLGVGIGLSFLLSQVHTTFVSIYSLKSSFPGIPVLGNITAITSEQQKAQERLKLGLFAIGFFGLAGVFLALLILEISQQSQAI
ncbi:XrtA system polysaccharide chain length determinant [Parapedomonas caeni]